MILTESSFKSEGYTKNPLTIDNDIYSRDMLAVKQADILLVDVTSATEKSIGTIMEMAWESILGKQIILVMNEGNVHIHAFVNQALYFQLWMKL